MLNVQDSKVAEPISSLNPQINWLGLSNVFALSGGNGGTGHWVVAGVIALVTKQDREIAHAGQADFQLGIVAPSGTARRSKGQPGP